MLHHNSGMQGEPGQALAAELDIRIPRMDGLSLRVAPVADFEHELHGPELEAVARAVPKRRQEFATGRHLARAAMRELGLPAAPVPRRADRSPAWPDGCLGSITHTNALAGVAVARAGVVEGIGIDLEESHRVSAELHDKLFTPTELGRYVDAPPGWADLLFSAKESVYKAVNPIVGKYIGFHEVEVDVTFAEQRFSARYVGEHAPNALLENGAGYFLFAEQHVFSVFIIP
jgi:4'-phosphopantetheinyl transferase EntD